MFGNYQYVGSVIMTIKLYICTLVLVLNNTY